VVTNVAIVHSGVREWPAPEEPERSTFIGWVRAFTQAV
jgi:hypothetical protein